MNGIAPTSEKHTQIRAAIAMPSRANIFVCFGFNLDKKKNIIAVITPVEMKARAVEYSL
jgi:hypothetical protein